MSYSLSIVYALYIREKRVSVVRMNQTICMNSMETISMLVL